jgi:hypothetical protein
MYSIGNRRVRRIGLDYRYLRWSGLLRPMVNFLIGISLSYILQDVALAGNGGSYVTTEKRNGSFTLAAAGKVAPLLASSRDYPGVIRVLKLLRNDIMRVTDIQPALVLDSIPEEQEIVIIGTLGKSPIVERLVRDKKLDVEDITGKWETFLIQIIEQPLPNVERALLIVGSDKRGTIYGMFDLSQQIGVSPWYWWADVPVKKKSNIYILPGCYSQGEPKVKYRGIFINDEAPALTGLVFEKFGGFNSKFYDHVFELILRLKGNFLWPAMWGRAFYDDDPENPRLADEYGVVISTSHHEPMMRAHDEWRRYGKGPWNYEKNDSVLREFWREGIRRMGNYESIVTLAMRGDGDEAMSPTANVALLQRIVADQRKILAEVTGKDVTTIPQVWALYKEVQEYYDKGMRVPDDVTILLCDDNWGNVRKLPRLDEKPRQGGYGMYYHFDFVGGPRNYKWLNTNQIERVWEEMHLSYEYGVRQIWIVNVGDIKPMEFPIDFFLDYAWNPEGLPADRLPEYNQHWAEEQFGAVHSQEIAEILARYTKYNSRRKPELLAPETYSLVNFREAETVVSEYNELVQLARKISDELPEEYHDAFYQLVLHPVEACANLNELYCTVAKNRLYASQGRVATNTLAQKAKELFARDAEITDYYNKIMAHGKWNHMMDQTHIGYTYWQQPDKNAMPDVDRIRPPEKPAMGVAIEGSDEWWPSARSEAVLPEFDRFNQQSYYIEIFNRGKKPFQYSIKPGKSWLKIDGAQKEVETEERLWVSVDWNEAPKGESRIPIIIAGPNKIKVTVQAVVKNPESNQINGFIESNGYISIDAENYTNAINSSLINWLVIPNLGRTASAITPMPVTAPSQTAGEASPHLEYRVNFFSTGEINVKTYLSPIQNFTHGGGLHYAVSFDGERPQVINVNEGEPVPDWKYPQWWNQMVSDNVKILTSKHSIREAGEHVLKFWMVDPGVVLQKIVIETGPCRPSYLGPPQSHHRTFTK